MKNRYIKQLPDDIQIKIFKINYQKVLNEFKGKVDSKKEYRKLETTYSPESLSYNPVIFLGKATMLELQFGSMLTPNTIRKDYRKFYLAYYPSGNKRFQFLSQSLRYE